MAVKRRAWKVRSIFGLLITALVVSISARAAESDWRLEKEEDGIRIYSRAVEGWSIREFRGVGEINAPLSSVVAAIDDVKTGVELVDVVVESRVHQRKSATQYYFYSLMDMPFPLTDRDTLTERVIKQDPETLTVTITDTATKGVMPPKDGLIRIEKSFQTWTLKPLPGGRVSAETRTLSDPAGPIPSALINTMSVNTPLNTLKKLNKIAQREAYAKAKPAFIRETPAKASTAPAPSPAASPESKLTARPSVQAETKVTEKTATSEASASTEGTVADEAADVEKPPCDESEKQAAGAH